MKFRRRPEEIEAVQFDGKGVGKRPSWFPSPVRDWPESQPIRIGHGQAVISGGQLYLGKFAGPPERVKPGSWIVRRPQPAGLDVLLPMTAEQFEREYEPA